VKNYYISITTSRISDKAFIAISQEGINKEYKMSKSHWFTGLIIAFIKYTFDRLISENSGEEKNER